MTTDYELRCTKTGRHWPAKTEGIARNMARNLGLVDYEIIPAKLVALS